MDIAIILTGHAYLPEAWAYADHLRRSGHSAQLVTSPDAALGADAAIAFNLAHQRQLHRLGITSVHEYHSLSAGHLRQLKDIVKRIAAPRPRARIFTESHIQKEIGRAHV